MVSPSQIPQIQQGNISPAASLLGNTTNALMSRINQRSKNSTDLLSGLLGQLGTGVREKLQAGRTNELDKQKFERELPVNLIKVLPNLQQQQQNALLMGDIPRSNQIDELIGQITNNAFKLGSTGTEAKAMGLPEPQGEYPTISEGSQSIMPTSQSSQGFQGIQPSTGAIPSGQEFAGGGGSSMVGDEMGIAPGGIGQRNLLFADKSAQVTGREQDVAKNRQQIIQGQPQTSDVQDFQRLSSLPEGSRLVSSQGVELKGVQSTPTTSEILTREALEDPKVRTQRRVDNTKSLKISSTIFDALDKVEKATTNDFFKDFGTRVEKSGFSVGPKQFGFEVLVPGQSQKLFSTLGQDVTKGEFAQTRQALDVEGVVTSQLGQLSRSISGEKGPLREEDMDRIAALIPSITDAPESFGRKKDIFKGVVLEVVLEEAFRTKDFTTFNNAQNSYLKTFGKPYQPGSSEGFLATYNASVPEDQRIAGKKGQFIQGQVNFNEGVDRQPQSRIDSFLNNLSDEEVQRAVKGAF